MEALSALLVLCEKLDPTHPHAYKMPISAKRESFLCCLSEQPSCRGFETPWRSYDITMCKGREFLSLRKGDGYVITSMESVIPKRLQSMVLLMQRQLLQNTKDRPWNWDRSWWSHDMETLPALLTLYEGNPSVTGGFPSQRASNGEPWCLLWYTAKSLI